MIRHEEFNPLTPTDAIRVQL